MRAVYISLFSMMLVMPVMAFEEIGLPHGYYTYQNHCAQTFDAQGKIGRMSFRYDGKTIKSWDGSCEINSVDFLTAGFLNIDMQCVESATGQENHIVQTLYPSQDIKRDRVKLAASYKNGVLISEGNPDWFHFCRGL